MEETSS